MKTHRFTPPVTQVLLETHWGEIKNGGTDGVRTGQRQMKLVLSEVIHCWEISFELASEAIDLETSNKPEETENWRAKLPQTEAVVE